MQTSIMEKELLSFLKQNGVMVLGENKAATNNQMGAMVGTLSDISKQFISESKDLLAKNTVIDIGCCYGAVSLAVLNNSNCEVVAIDADERHVNLLQDFIKNQHPNLSNRITTMVDNFPKHFLFENNSISAIHASHLLQFLSGDDIIEGLKKCYNALHANGKIYLTTTSVFLPWLSTSFHNAYSERVGKIKWPGEIKNFKDYAPEAGKPFIGDFFHVLTKEELLQILENIGFIIEENYYYNLQNPAIHSENQEEMIGVIAIKP